MRTNETPLGFVLSPVAFAVTVAASASAAGGCGSGRAVAVPAGAAFGVLLLECLQGRCPWERKCLFSKIRRILYAIGDPHVPKVGLDD